MNYQNLFGEILGYEDGQAATYAACFRCWKYSMIPHTRLVCDSCFGDPKAGEIRYGCSMCGYGSFERPGQVCDSCQKPEAA